MLPVSDCSTFRIMCYVPSTAVFCSECIECFAATAFKFFFTLFVTIPVAPIITGIIIISCYTFVVCLYILLYFLFFSPFCMTFLSAGSATFLSMHDFFLFLIIISGLWISSLPVFIFIWEAPCADIFSNV